MKRVVLFLLTSLLIAQSHADLLTVVEDAKMLKATYEQIEHIKSLKTKLEQQLSTLNHQKDLLSASQKAMTGHYGYSSLFNNSSLNAWQHSGKEWSSLLEKKEKDALFSFKEQLNKDFPVTKNPFSQNPEQVRLFDLLSKTTLASRATHALTYNAIEEELQTLEKLQAEIEKSPNQKSTLDLIARIQIEEAKLTAYQMKSQALKAELVSLQSQKEITDAKWASEFFKWHD